jgi:hypothetical protein
MTHHVQARAAVGVAHHVQARTRVPAACRVEARSLVSDRHVVLLSDPLLKLGESGHDVAAARVAEEQRPNRGRAGK